jgi:DNA-3-methyladenine glycosylase
LARRRPDRDLARGPARLCQALGIDMALNGADAVDPQSPLRVSAGPDGPVPADRVCAGPRIGISQAVDVPWRFWLDGDDNVSQYRTFTPRRSRS